MSTMYVNKVQELNVGSGVQIPGHVIQVVEAEGSGIIYFGASTSSYTNLITLNITPKFSNSLINEFLISLSLFL